MRRVCFVGLVILLSGCTLDTAATPTKPLIFPTITPTPAAAAAPSTATAVPTAVPTPTAVPHVVVVIDNPAPVRQSPAQDAPVLFTLDVDTELSVLGPDTTGPDGATRWVHVAANGTDGYVRSDLVSAPHAYATATPIPPPTPRPTATTDPNTPVTVHGRTIAMSVGRKYYDPVSPGEFGNNRPGFRYVAYDVTITNIGGTSQGYSSIFASVRTADNRKYPATIAIVDLVPILAGGTLFPGASDRGWLLFEIPTSARVTALDYSDILNTLEVTFT